MLKSIGMTPFQRFGTVLLNSYIPRNVPDEPIKQKVGWTPQYGKRPVFASNREIQQTVSSYYDQPMMNQPLKKSSIVADVRNEIDRADYERWMQHQEYINNKPVIKVKEQPMDFNNPDVQDKLASMEDNTDIMKAINNFETRLSQLRLTPAKRDELRNEFYSRIVQADHAVIYNIAKDEQGKSINDILNLLQSGAVGGGKPNIIEGGKGGQDSKVDQIEVSNPYEPLVPNYTTRDLEDYAQLMINNFLEEEKETEAVIKRTKALIVDELQKLNKIGDFPIDDVQTAQAITFNALDVAKRVSKKEPEMNQMDQALEEYMKMRSAKKKGGMPKDISKVVQPDDFSKAHRNPQINKVLKAMTKALENAGLETTDKNKEKLYKRIVKAEADLKANK